MSTPLYDLVINNLTANNYPPVDASTLSIGIVNTAVLGTGTANSSTILYGDSTWRLPSTNVVATAAEFLQGNTVQTNSTVLIVGSNVAINTSTAFVGNSTVNTVVTAGQISLSGVTVNSTIYQGTANNATFAYGKAEADLNVNSAATALVANNATFAYGKTEGNLNVNSAVFLVTNTITTNTTVLAVGANVAINTSALFIGNSSVNTAITAGSITLNGGAVIHVNSTTGINASALSTGTIPIARLPEVNSSASGIINTVAQSMSGAKTFLGGITANGIIITTGAGLTANGSLGTAGWVLTTNGTGPYWAAAAGGGGTVTGDNAEVIIGMGVFS